METIILGFFGSLIPVALVYLNLRKDKKLTELNEIYVKKLNYYEELVCVINASLYDPDYKGVELNSIYHKGLIIASDDVILELNKYFKKFSKSESVPRVEVRENIAGILVACRNDLLTRSMVTVDDYNLNYVK